MDLIEKRNLYDSFLQRWPEERVQSMVLTDYVDVGNHDTFFYWVEHETRQLGSILGSPASKFGIYKRNPEKQPDPRCVNDSEYSWRRRFGETREKAFENVRHEVLKVIRMVETGNFRAIDEIPLSLMFKWKIAFLYSNERLVPIYEEKTLNKIGKHLGLQPSHEILVSEIQERMMQNKPADLNIYEYMESLWYQFSGSAREDDHNVELVAEFNNRSISAYPKRK